MLPFPAGPSRADRIGPAGSLASHAVRRETRSMKAEQPAHYRDLILVLLAKEFKARYKNTFLG